MDVEMAVAAAGAEGMKEKETEKLLNKVWRYSLFLYFGMMIMAIAPRAVALASSPTAGVPLVSVCHDVRHRLTGTSFIVVTLVMQKMLACVLERRPAPAPRLTPMAAWPLAIFTWMFVTMFCLSYVAFGVRTYYSEWILAGVTSAVNLAMAALTVMEYDLD